MRSLTVRQCVQPLIVLAAVWGLAACQTTPPTVVYIVISPTPEPTLIAAASAATAETTPALTEAVTEVPPPPSPTLTPDQPATDQVIIAQAAASQTADALILVQATQTAESAFNMATAQAAAVTAAAPVGSPTPALTAVPPGFPTPVMAQIQVAEQVFENGRMYWLQPTGEIWVLVVTAEGRGTWSVYPDTYIDGETLPTVAPAPSGLITPERGFGKLWREAASVRQALGYAMTPEFGYVSPYEYHAGGVIDAAGVYQAGPGHHILYSLYNEQFRFDETDSTWRLGGV